ncbi:MAG: EamA family transporter RarD [Nibricoccus sp.]
MPNTAPNTRPWGSLTAASASYLIWGLFPIYWRLLKAVDALELITHRVVWSLLFLLIVVAAQKRLPEFRQAFTAKNIGVHAMSGGLLTINWLVYVWGVNAGHVIECSLGYFLVPLLNVILGRWLLHEKLRRVQISAIALATFGVAVMIWQAGRPPWIALALAATFSLYGLLRKRSSLGPLMGLTMETVLLLPFAGAFLVWLAAHQRGALGHVSPALTLMILSTGVVTAIPLLLFAKGARGLRMVTLGLLQYLAPTCQFLLGWAWYGEPMSAARASAFSLIWAGLALYSMDALLASRKPRA